MFGQLTKIGVLCAFAFLMVACEWRSNSVEKARQMLSEIFLITVPDIAFSDERAEIHGVRSTVVLKYRVKLPVSDFKAIIAKKPLTSGPYQTFHSRKNSTESGEWWEIAERESKEYYLLMSPVYQGGNLYIYIVNEDESFVTLYMYGVWRDD